ncbi:hypothetical protein NP233_g12284 [Leucocoprinus birnbaumii]|uniref:DUF6589 domain-containing protein n=1 Tax=Leucocoprinus birnbaumii TaxID=56174 RepID=A0AAD5VKE6_9AGAR|nr:hypothetical protein NP233_g12284 [Leucocoprinus birnbaumii]
MLASLFLLHPFTMASIPCLLNNFDMTFKVAEPTLENHLYFVSATSATAVPIYRLVNKEDLRCSWQLWACDPKNPDAIDPFYIDLDCLREFELKLGTRRKRGEKQSVHAERLAWHVHAILVNHGPACFTKYKSFLKEPDTVNQIPLHKTNQIPCCAMNIKESTQDGNIEVMEDLLKQGGLGEKGSSSFKEGKDDGIKTTQKIECTPKRCFQYVVFVPGLFYYLMVCADVIWHLWVLSMASCDDPNSLVNHVKVLHSGESKKFTSKPGFQMMHQVIQHDIWASMLDCWGLVVCSENTEWAMLEEFGASEPSWECIVELSHAIVKKYVASTERISHLHNEPKSQHDWIFENQLLRNRDELNYLELYHAMSSGDIGRVEGTLLNWIYMFKATGKHKYVAHMLEFMYCLSDYYSPELAHIIHVNWLCNPTGKEGGFRGVDWMVERNNLYTKVIYGGSSSNQTLDRIIEESVLIEFFCACHVSMENRFYLKNRTIHHSRLNMTKSLKALGHEFAKTDPHVFTPGRTAKYEAPNSVALGMDGIQNNKDVIAAKEGVDKELNHEIESGDLAVVDF